MEGIQSQAKSASTETFVTALVFNSALFAAEIAAFTILRPRFKAVYEQRTIIPQAEKRIASMGNSWFAWPTAVYNADYRQAISLNGLDTYFFLRFLRMMVRVFLPIWFISWAVLLPVTSVDSHVPGQRGLDRFTFANVENTKQIRYVAHIILVYFFTAWIFYNIWTEMAHFIIERQKYLISPVHSASAQARTVLVMGIPRSYLSIQSLRKLYDPLPGGVKAIWINRNLKGLPDVYDEQLSACSKLEAAETKLLALAIKAQSTKSTSPASGSKAHTAADVEDKSATPLEQLVPRNERPTHRLGPLGLWGRKVDTIEWAREEILRTKNVLEKARKTLKEDDGEGDDEEEDNGQTGNKAQTSAIEQVEKYPVMNSAFITFNKQIGAYAAKQILPHHLPYRMTSRYTNVSPDDIIWSNLNFTEYEMKVRTIISYGITAALVIFWVIPVGFIGIISNIHQLCAKYKWLAWLCHLPSPIVGILQGVLPPLLLVLLMMLLPIILRMLARFEGIPKKSGVELSLMTRFFIFQVIHSFLIVTISSGITAALETIVNHPNSVATQLAQELPKASNFFLTYVILQGLSGTAAGFLQAVTLVLYYVKLVLLGSTPRSVFEIKYGLKSVEWGTLWPGITLLTVVALGYMIISPIINGLACATFFAFYMLYKYLFLWQLGQPVSEDTGGLFFPKAIQQVFVGLYVQQVCLCALFFLARNAKKRPSAVVEGALMVALIVLTAFFHMFINDSYGPLKEQLPLTLAEKASGAPDHAEDRNNSTSHDDIGRSFKDEHGKGAPAEVSQVETKHYPFEDQFGFAQPAASRPQRVVWLPVDKFGLAKEEERENRELGIACAAQDAIINENGKVDVSGPPPDEPELPAGDSRMQLQSALILQEDREQKR